MKVTHFRLLFTLRCSKMNNGTEKLGCIACVLIGFCLNKCVCNTTDMKLSMKQERMILCIDKFRLFLVFFLISMFHTAYKFHLMCLTAGSVY